MDKDSPLCFGCAICSIIFIINCPIFIICNSILMNSLSGMFECMHYMVICVNAGQGPMVAPWRRTKYVVSIRTKISHAAMCTGILIRGTGRYSDHMFVVTAAHCVEEGNQIGDNPIVHIGIHRLNDGSDVEGVKVHSLFSIC